MDSEHLYTEAELDQIQAHTQALVDEVNAAEQQLALLQQREARLKQCLDALNVSSSYEYEAQAREQLSAEEQETLRNYERQLLAPMSATTTTSGAARTTRARRGLRV